MSSWFHYAYAACSVFMHSLMRPDIRMRVFIASIHVNDFSPRIQVGGRNPPTIHSKPALRVHDLLELNGIEFKLNQFKPLSFINVCVNIPTFQRNYDCHNNHIKGYSKDAR